MHLQLLRSCIFSCKLYTEPIAKQKLDMSKQEKLIDRLLNAPADFTWQELSTLLKGLGYQEVQGSGSRVKFDNGLPEQMINLHRPHPAKIIKRYALRQVIEKLKQAELI